MAVPYLLPGCPTYLSTVSLDRPTRLTRESKEEQQFAQALQQSLEQQKREDLRFRVHSYQDLIAKISSHNLPDKWMVWHFELDTIHIYQPELSGLPLKVKYCLTICHFVIILLYILHRTSKTRTELCGGYSVAICQ